MYRSSFELRFKFSRSSLGVRLRFLVFFPRFFHAWSLFLVSLFIPGYSLVSTPFPRWHLIYGGGYLIPGFFTFSLVRHWFKLFFWWWLTIPLFYIFNVFLSCSTRITWWFYPLNFFLLFRSYIGANGFDRVFFNLIPYF